MNPYLKSFGARLDQRFFAAFDGQTTADWVSANTTMGGKPFSTDGYEFQATILNDDHPNMDVKKPSQVGMTEVQIRKALAFVSRNQNVSLIFTLPNENLYRKVSQTRIQPLVMKDRVFNLERDEDAVRSMSIIQVGDSYLYITACTEADATSTAADAVYNDELDISDQQMIALFQSRLQNSDRKINQRFSTPTFQNFGVDAGFRISDQRFYLQKCDACGHWNWPEFNTKSCIFPDLPKHVEDLMELTSDDVNSMDLSKAYVACTNCHQRLVGKQEWVPKFPGRTLRRGYWISPFSTTRITLPYIVDQLLKYKQRDYLRGFYNTVLGATFSDARTQIPRECIEAAMNKGSANMTELPRGVPLRIGIDMGQTCHMTVTDVSMTKILLQEAIPVAKLHDRVKFLLANYSIISGGVDRLPYTPNADALRVLSRNVIMPIQYAVTKDSDAKLVPDAYGMVDHGAVNRTKMLDEVADGFRNYEMELNGYGHQKEVVIEHFRDMVREEKPEEPAKWVKLTGTDHYFHSLALVRAGARLRPLVQEFINGDGPTDLFGFELAQFGVKQQGLPGFGVGLGMSHTRSLP